VSRRSAPAVRRRVLRWLVLALRLAATVRVVRRLVWAARPAAPLNPPPADRRAGAASVSPDGSISVVVPARDEGARIGACLERLAAAPGVDEVVVVDDGSSDGTAAIARAFGATVLAGRELPDGWAGKAWALHQGLEAASGDWVVTLDADTRPDPRLPAAAVARAAATGADLLTVAGRFDCPTPGSRWLHPALLTTLVYRFGPPHDGASELANGQCMVLRRQPFLDGGGLTPVAGHLVEDVALARHVTAGGGRVVFVDGTDLLGVRMFESLADTWHGWGRSLALPGVTPPRTAALDAATVALTQGAPLLRLAAGRADLLDGALALLRVGTLVGTARAYRRRGPAYWLSVLADPLAAARLAWSTVRPARTWRGRTYDRRTTDRRTTDRPTTDRRTTRDPSR
jgi:dolichol-phosphate mannosyltransferase